MCRVIETPAPRPAIDFSAFDPSIRVQDDLFRHVNGTWLNTTEIPADKPLTGAFMELRDQAEAAVRDIITNLLTNQSSKTLTSDGGREKLKKQMLAAISSGTDVKVHEILFTDLAVQ